MNTFASPINSSDRMPYYYLRGVQPDRLLQDTSVYSSKREGMIRVVEKRPMIYEWIGRKRAQALGHSCDPVGSLVRLINHSINAWMDDRWLAGI